MSANPQPAGIPSGHAIAEYAIDALQRGVLFCDVLRQRSQDYYRHKAMIMPHVLGFDLEMILDARNFQRPVNFWLARIAPPAGVVIDALKRPFVVFDPRAGQGPGIGGFKADSELGVAMKAGHTCYFVGFTPDPMPHQTIDDVMHAHGHFLEAVIACHTEAEGMPCVIGNCQAGWAVMMLAAVRPELFGPIIIAGTPLSFWAGLKGQNPSRYSGGMVGGSWLTALTSDIGGGTFDGGHLVSGFDNLDPANSLWSKYYHLWANIDTEAPRFLEFEKWWGGHADLSAEEMQWIVDELFIGNRMATAELVSGDGTRIDLRHIRSPILCFCSEGDNITPPPQALGWICDLYSSDEDIFAADQTIVYAIHESVGHLGIFVSGSVARKQHQEFSSNIDLIDVLPPGLYQAVMTPKTDSTVNPQWVEGDWLVRFEPRSLADVAAIVQPNLDDERRFATVKRISDINLGLYRTLLQPLVQAQAKVIAAVSAQANADVTEWLHRLTPAELPYHLFSERNPLMAPLASLAERVKKARKPVSDDNWLVKQQESYSCSVVAALDDWRDFRDGAIERCFMTFYGSPVVQAMAGLKTTGGPPRPHPGKTPESIARVERCMAENHGCIGDGGVHEAVVRGLVYIAMGGGGVDERAFNALREIHAEYSTLSLGSFKKTVREQFFVLRLDQKAALDTIPVMLSVETQSKDRALSVIHRAVSAAGKLTAEQSRRLAVIEGLFAE
ncbi:uncharacterized protein DUF3141 [Marinobacter sp. LV10R520-4]|uniref:DUF3141 domain-containing protein n=1 Tax=Marinobacter sp. LV10R520-4 TaxID=1761796 RepID=UPI000BF2DC79|nr:DUF3141 domain-containing protein [Marinobacter sp. LV10R520-4]PFG51863.1 uncharacterized protein DUF3141 [Marinobacter sp. LV10R520-4]